MSIFGYLLILRYVVLYEGHQSITEGNIFLKDVYISIK